MAACALWMWYYGSLDVTLYDDEAEAADDADQPVPTQNLL